MRLRGRYTKTCHMLADGLDELHAMAERIGMKRSWFQASPPSSYPHYDLTESRRAEAVKLGAVPVDRRGLRELLKRLRGNR